VYLARQLRNFRDGVRGAAPDDQYGNQMRAAVPRNWEDDTMVHLAEFISGL
jgi:cytochrome c553